MDVENLSIAAIRQRFLPWDLANRLDRVPQGIREHLSDSMTPPQLRERMATCRSCGRSGCLSCVTIAA